MTAKEIIDIKVRVMSMAIEIYRLHNHSTFNTTRQQIENNKSVSTIYNELVTQLELKEYV